MAFSIDSEFKIDINLRRRIMEQLIKFNYDDNLNLINELKQLTESTDDQLNSSTTYLKINLYELNKIVKSLTIRQSIYELKNVIRSLSDRKDVKKLELHNFISINFISNLKKQREYLIEKLITLDPVELKLRDNQTFNENDNFNCNLKNNCDDNVINDNSLNDNIINDSNLNDNIINGNNSNDNSSNDNNSNKKENSTNNCLNDNSIDSENFNLNHNDQIFDFNKNNDTIDDDDCIIIDDINSIDNNSINNDPINIDSNNYSPINIDSNNYSPINIDSNNYSPINNDPINYNSNETQNTFTTDNEDKIYPHIFKYLTIHDLLNCRLVSKKFKYYSENCNYIDKLTIGAIEENDDWFYNKELLKEEYLINLKCYHSIRSLSIFNLEQNLKILKLNRINCDFKLDDELKNLINLELLEIDCNSREDKFIDLKNLKILVFYKINGKLTLNTEKLNYLAFGGTIRSIEFKSNPLSLKHLITWFYEDRLQIFKNLENLELFDSDAYLDKSLLFNFKYLKEFKLRTSRFKFSSFYNKIKDNFIFILKKRQFLRRNIDIYLEGVKIKSIDQFDKIKTCRTILKYQLENFDLLDLDLSFISKLNFNELENYFDNLRSDLPIGFFNKFSFLTEININEKVNIDNLNYFLINLKNFRKLSITNASSFDQHFFNCLPNSIKELYIQDYKNLNIDYYFILIKLTKLEQWYTSDDKDLFDFVLKLFSSLKFFNIARFNYNDNDIEVTRCDSIYFNLRHNQCSKRSINFNQLRILFRSIKGSETFTFKRKKLDQNKST